jgi:hypothetical protein
MTRVRGMEDGGNNHEWRIRYPETPKREFGARRHGERTEAVIVGHGSIFEN